MAHNAPSVRSQPASGTKRVGRATLAVILAAAAVSAGLLVYGGSKDVNQPGPGPPIWNVVVPSNPVVDPGHAGCQNRTEETCASVWFYADVTGEILRDINFSVEGPPRNSSNVRSGIPVPMGSSASVEAFNASGAVVGAWNWSMGYWTLGGSSTIPASIYVTLVFDTGLTNADLQGDVFWTSLSQGYGSVGIPMNLLV